MINYWVNRFITLKIALAVFLIAVIAVTTQSILSPGISIENIQHVYTGYNNYVIFKLSFKHMIDNQDIYVYFLDEHWDLFKYTPTFSFLMAPFYALPDPIGLFIWNAINCLFLLWGIWLFPFKKQEWKIWALIIIFIELITSIQNSQANGIMAGLIILAFSLIEKKKYIWGIFLICLSVFIKPFGVFAFAFFLFHPHKMKHALYAAVFSVILFLLPLLVISFDQLIFLYKSWLHLLSWDMDESTGLSVQGMMNTWFQFYPDKNHTLLVGLLLLILPLAQYWKWKEIDFKINYLAYILVWIIIFNHKAESPTFVIAVAGIAIWFLNSNKNIVNIILLVLVILLTVLSPTDIFPFYIRQHYIKPYVLKAVPCILVFMKILFDLCVTSNRKPAAAIE